MFRRHICFANTSFTPWQGTLPFEVKRSSSTSYAVRESQSQSKKLLQILVVDRNERSFSSTVWWYEHSAIYKRFSELRSSYNNCCSNLICFSVSVSFCKTDCDVNFCSKVISHRRSFNRLSFKPTTDNFPYSFEKLKDFPSPWNKIARVMYNYRYIVPLENLSG